MKQVVAELTHLARAVLRHQPALRRVGARVASATTRTCCPARLKRADPPRRERGGAARERPRRRWSPSTGGKIEMETVGDGGEDKVLLRLVQKAVLNVFNRLVRRRRSWPRW